MDVVQWLEQSAFATWLSEGGSLWGYPTVLFLHTFGLSTVAGINAAIDLRVLGFARKIPLAPLARLLPLLWTAFGVTAATGTALLVKDLSTNLANTVFYFKLLFIALALVNLRMLTTRVLRAPAVDVDTGPLPSGARLLAVTSLLLWTAATTAGRLMAYLAPVGGFD